MSPNPTYKISQQVLNDFSATVEAKPNLTTQEIFSKFPEFHNDSHMLQSAMDYYETSKSGKYKSLDELNSKFPEFGFDSKEVQQQQVQQPTISQPKQQQVDFGALNQQIQDFKGFQNTINKPNENQLSIVDPLSHSGSVDNSFEQDKNAAKTYQDAALNKLSQGLGISPDEVKQTLADFPNLNDAQALKQYAKLKQDNPNLYNRTVASSTWQSNLLGDVRNVAPEKYNEIATQIQQMQQGGAGTSFKDASNNLKYTRELINTYIQDPAKKEQALNALKEDAAYNYSGETQGTDEALNADTNTAFLNKPEKLAMQFLKDSGDPSYQGFANNVSINPATIQQVSASGKPDMAAIGYSEQKAQLASIGTDLQLRAANEHLTDIQNKFLNHELSDQEAYEASQKWTKVKEDAQALQDRIHNPNDKEYGYAAQFELNNIAQELVGQKSGFLSIQGNEFRNNINAPILSAIEMGSSLFSSDENNKRMQLAIIGAGAKDESANYVTQANQPMRSFKIKLPADLSDKITDINNDSKLSDDEKRQQVKDILASDSRWYKQPTDPKFNLKGAGLLYGVADATNAIGSFLVTQAGMGGFGAGRALTTFSNVMMSQYSKDYENNLKNNVANPSQKALQSSAINGAAFAVGDNVGAIRKLLGNTAAGEVVGKMSDDEVLNIIKHKPSSFERLTKGFASSQAGNLQMTAIGTAGQMLNDAANGKMQSPEDYGRSALLMFASNAPLSLLGVGANISKLNELQRHSWYEVANNPNKFLSIVDNNVSKGLLSPDAANLIRQDIQKASAVHQSIDYTYDDGKLMSDDDKAKRLMVGVQEEILSEEAKKAGSDKRKAQLEHEAAVTHEYANLIHDNADIEDLQKRKDKLQKDLDAVDENGKPKLNDKDKAATKAQIDAIEQYTKNKESEPAKENTQTGNISNEPVATEESKPIETITNQEVQPTEEGQALRSLPNLNGNDNADKAYQQLDDIDFNNPESVDKGISDILQTINNKFIPKDKENQVLRDKEKLIGNSDYRSKDYLEKYIALAGKDFEGKDVNELLGNKAPIEKQTGVTVIRPEERKPVDNVTTIGDRVDDSGNANPIDSSIPKEEPIPEGQSSEAGVSGTTDPVSAGDAETPPPVLEPPISANTNAEQPPFTLIKDNLRRARVELGLDDYEGESVSNAEAIQKAHRTITDWKEKGTYAENINKIIEDVHAGKISDANQNVLAQHIADLRVTLKSGLDRNSEQYDTVLKELSKAIDAGDAMRSEAGRTLGRNRLQMRGKAFDDVSEVELDMMDDKGIDTLTPEMKAEAEKRFNEVKEKLDKESALRIQAEEEIARLKAEKNLSESKKSTSKSEKKSKEDYVKEREDIKNRIKDKWKNTKAGGELYALPIPLPVEFLKKLKAVAPDVSKLIASYVQENGNIVLDEARQLLKKDLEDAGVDATDEQIRDLIAGNYNDKKPTRSELAQKVMDLRAEEKDLLEQERNPPANEDEEKFKTALKRRIQVNKDQQKAVEEKIRNNDFSEDTKGESILDNKEFQRQNPQLYEQYLQSVIDRDNAKYEYEKKRLDDQIKNRGILGKFGNALDIALTTSKGMVATFDQSGLLVQMLISTGAHPIEAAKTIPLAIRDMFTNKFFDRRMAKIKNSNYYSVIQGSGLALFDTKGIGENVRNEILGGDKNLLNRDITVAGKKFSVGKGLERSTATLFNNMRLYLFESAIDRLAQQKGALSKMPDTFFKDNDAEIKNIARVVNEITGHGKVHEGIASSTNALNKVIWSPKMMASTFNVLGLGDALKFAAKATGAVDVTKKPELGKGFYASLSPAQRKFAIEQVARFVGTTAVVMLASKLTGMADDIDLNPLSTNFGSITKGNKTIQLFGRYGSAIKAVGQIATSKRVIAGKEQDLDAPHGKSTGEIAFSAFIRGKMTPVAGLTYDYLFNKKTSYYTKSKLTPGTILQALTIPISFNEMGKDFKRDDVATATFSTLFKIYGGNIVDKRDFDITKKAKIDVLKDNLKSSDIDKTTIKNYKAGGRGITDAEFNTFVQKRDAYIQSRIETWYSKGLSVVNDKGNVVVKKYSDMTGDEIKKEMQAIKESATRKTKETLFGKKVLTGKQRIAESKLRVARKKENNE